ncbi:DUF4126 domain-containing protein [Armatimonas rosea]|uniref:DUF4126 domain-containing protein n=1 Tax=Armatimonas rosea TaxID=685828 RepID=A0A7W9SNI6_ARMRO|nr:DUF4126 domain-containing protein [Armatimonas rosea]MBB6049253.1 hypothetical protein [Armatimonas rosea]
MGGLATLGMALGSAWVSGINLYATVATLGLLGRFAHLTLPGDLTILTSWWVIGVALVLYVVEFIADKIPVVDHAWDAIHTFLRVPAGAVLAAGAFGHFDPTIKTIAFLIGGTIALSSHGAKAAARPAINAAPGAGALVSLAEDGVAIGTASLAAFYPAAAIVVVVVGVGISLFLFSRIRKALLGLFKKPG